MYIWECGSSPIRLSASPIGPVAARMTALGRQTREKRVSVKDAIQALNAVIGRPGTLPSPDRSGAADLVGDPGLR